MTNIELTSFSNTKLKEICRANNISGFSGKTKDELLMLISSHFTKDNELRYIDLFCGIGGFHQALSELGAKCVLASDIDKKCCESYKLNYGIEPVNDIKNIDEKSMVDFDIICGGFPCFVAGTKVLTNAGYKCIENVNLDDTLMTHTGRFQNILNLQQKTYTGMLYNIKIKNHPSFIRCTEEHPFYVREKNDTIFKNPEWKKAVDLTKNDYFGMKINENSIIPEFTFNKKNTTEAIDMILEDSDMWFMMGYFVGDGWIEETTKDDGCSINKIMFAINSKDNEYVVDIINKILKITDRKCPSGDKRDNYECDNYEWFNILQHFGKCAESKVIPEWVQDAPKEHIQEFMNGYVKTECYNKSNNISYNLAFELQRLYIKLGCLFTPLPSSLCNSVKTAHGVGVLKEQMCNVDTTNYSKTVDIEGITEKERDTGQFDGIQSYFIENGYIWSAPSEIYTEYIENKLVYNFEVNNDNSYIVENTIVHNCQPFSNGGNKKTFNDKRGLLFDEIMRIAKEKKPKFMFLENVKHILKVSEGAVFEYIKQQIKENGYELQVFQMSPHNYGIPQQRERVFFVCIRNDIYNGKDIELIEEDKGLTAEDIIEDDPDPKYNISDDVRNVLDAWDELIKQFEIGEKLSPTIMMHDAYKKYTDAEFNALPSWRRDYITRNKPLFAKYKNIIDPWYKKHKELLSKREIYGQLEWQTGPVSENESIYNHFIQLRQSGLRIKKGQYFPTLVAITQTPIYGKYKRHITPRECARLQSFPETFILDPSDRVTYKQMGNSVNVFNVSTVIKSTLEHYKYI